MDRLIIIGAGGHGKVAADVADKMGAYAEIAFLDDGAIGECLGYPVLGKVADAEKYIATHSFFVAIGSAAARRRVMGILTDSGADIATLIHPSAVIGKGVTIGRGSIVVAGAVINPCAKIGEGCIINTQSSVDHDCTVGDYVHVSVGAHLTGTVVVGDDCFIGAGAVIKNNTTICAGCTIGAGAVVVKNIEEKGTYVGVPAKLMI